MDPRAQRRLHVLNHVLAGALTAAQAAELLELSLRQVRRLLASYRTDGVAALVHGNRGQPPANRLDDQLRQRVVELASGRYAGVNRAHLAELLAEREEILIAERSLRRVCAEAEQFAGRRAPTQLGRALEEAGIAWIAARSPQAKGRIERLWGTCQDRLRAELRLGGAASLAEANVVLADYLPRHNARFAVDPVDPVPAWRPLAAGQAVEALFCFAYPRRVANDATVRLDGEVLALPHHLDRHRWSGRRVIVQERLNGSRWAVTADEQLPLSPAPPEPVTLRARGTSRGPLASEWPAGATSPPVASPSPGPATALRRPSANHPWRDGHTGFSHRR